MKNIILFQAIILLLSVTGMAQVEKEEDKKVAVFDPEGNVNNSYKNIIREEIGSIIVNTGGFIVLERKLINKVLEENKYQLSDFVDDSQIVELGKHMGANLVFVTLITEMSDKNFHISCKLIDVESARVEKHKTRQTVYKESDLISTVKNIAENIINSFTKQYKTDLYSVPLKESTEILAVKGSRVFTFDKGLQEKLSAEEVRNKIKIDPIALKYYNQGIEINKKGNQLVSIGAALSIGGIVLLSCLRVSTSTYKGDGTYHGLNIKDLEYREDYYYGFLAGGTIGLVGGIATLIPGIVFKVQAKKNIGKAVDMYNKGKTFSNVMIKLGFSNIGVGMALKF